MGTCCSKSKINILDSESESLLEGANHGSTPRKRSNANVCKEKAFKCQQNTYSFNTCDVETHPNGNELIQEISNQEWRLEPKFDIKSLKEEVEEYYPLRDRGVSEDALRHVNILFVGQVGAGKSSFINSVESAFRCYVTMTASAGSRSKSLTSMVSFSRQRYTLRRIAAIESTVRDHVISIAKAGSRDKSVTLAFRKYTIISSKTRRPLRFQLCDCRGLQDGIDITQDIDHILEGHMRNNYVINSTNALKVYTCMDGYKQQPNLEDKIHCVVYVLDAEKHSTNADIHASFITADVKKQIETIQEKIELKGIPQLILLTKVDSICESTRQSTSNVYRSSLIRQRCIAAAECLGLNPMTVLPMRNYFSEVSTTEDISILALFNVRQMLRSADSFLRVNHLKDFQTYK